MGDQLHVPEDMPARQREQIESGPEWVKFTCSLMVEPGIDRDSLNEYLRETLVHTEGGVMGVKNTLVEELNDPDSWLPNG